MLQQQQQQQLCEALGLYNATQQSAADYLQVSCNSQLLMLNSCKSCGDMRQQRWQLYQDFISYQAARNIALFYSHMYACGHWLFDNMRRGI
jgi:hypothetical protein